jgi:hypothetical protein
MEMKLGTIARKNRQRAGLLESVVAKEYSRPSY